jgi:hypothetical protein
MSAVAEIDLTAKSRVPQICEKAKKGERAGKLLSRDPLQVSFYSVSEEP